MMTPQEVAGFTFAKAMMGGYNMAAVDEFLDKLTEDYTALYNENNALKGKLKVLADKMKEYREMEDAMRAALLTAQKTATSIVSEAEAKRDAIIADTAMGAKHRLEEINQEVAAQERRLADIRAGVDRQLAEEEQRLAAGQDRLRTFIRDVTAVCEGQLALLKQLPDLPVSETPPAPAPAAPAPVEERPAEAPAPQPEPVPVSGDIAKELEDVFSQDQAEDAQREPAEVDVASLFTPGDGRNGGADEAATRVLNLDDLQFGRNYNSDKKKKK